VHRTLALTAAITTLVWGPLIASPRAQAGDYVAVDNIEGTYVTTNLPPVTPWCVFQSNLFVLNQHDSEVRWFSGAGLTHLATYKTPWMPSSIGCWIDSGGSLQLYIACSGNYGICVMNAATGEILDFIQLVAPAGVPYAGERLDEPRDLVIDQATGKAYVSCAGSSTILEIDLESRTPTKSWKLPCVDPVALALDPQGRVLTAALISGNATGAVHVNQNRPSGDMNLLGYPSDVVDLSASGTVLFPNPLGFPPGYANELPDQDVFRIDPSQPWPPSFAPDAGYEVVGKGVGTILFDVGVNRFANDAIVVVGTDALNDEMSCETNMAGRFAVNQFASFQAGQTVIPVEIDARVLVNGVLEVDPGAAVGQPCALEFKANGNLLVAGALTDRVVEVTPGGARVAQWDLPAGSIPRALLRVGNKIFVYCWGTNRVLTFVGQTQVDDLDLGGDPAPEAVQRGRALFYDGRRSRFQNMSCATCHVDGRTDMLVWDLGCLDDDKGPLLTQTLAGIEETGPYHWRGDRSKLDGFNGAFDSLLGFDNPALPIEDPPAGLLPDEMEDFRAFVFAVKMPANVNQDLSRKIRQDYEPKRYEDSTIITDPNGILPAPGTAANAWTGQSIFAGVIGSNNCSFCHAFPLGTQNDLQPDGNPEVKRFALEVPHLKGKDRNTQDLVPHTQELDIVQLVYSDLQGGQLDPPHEYSFLGASTTHAGLSEHPNEVAIFLLNTPQERLDVAAFLEQWDNGLAPAAHLGAMMTADPSNHAFIQAYLVDQARYLDVSQTQSTGFFDCGLVVLGDVDLDGSGTRRRLRWALNDELAGPKFVCEDPTTGVKTFTFFKNKALAGDGTFLFLGVPKGMERRFGIDFDDDGLGNLEESTYGTDPLDADTDDDGLEDGYEVQQQGDPLDPSAPLQADTTPPSFVLAPEVFWVTARNARIRFVTSEKTTATVVISGPSDQTLQIDTATRRHNLLVNCLEPSTAGSQSYTADVTVTDFAGNQTSQSFPFQTTPFSALARDVLTRFRLAGDPQATPQGLVFTVDASVAARQDTGLPSNDRVLVCRALVRDANGMLEAAPVTVVDPSTLLPLGIPTRFDRNGKPYVPPSGAADRFILSPTKTVNGDVSFTFEVQGVNLTHVEIEIHDIAAVTGTWPPAVNPPDLSLLGLHVFPATPAELRKIVWDF